MDRMVDDSTPDNDFTVQAAGALRGAAIGLARVVTRPAQMKVIVWLAKRRWKAAAGSNKPLVHDLGANMLIEGVIGTVMYSVYDKMLLEIKNKTGESSIPGGVFTQALVAGAAAGAASSALSTPHNNLVQHHAETTHSILKGFRTGTLAFSGKHSIFRGMSRSIVRDSAAAAVMFSSSLWFKQNLPQPAPDSILSSTAQASIAGGLAGMASALAALPLHKPAAWSTQYAGSHIFFLAGKLGIRNTFIAGVPPALAAAFIPNALGMGAFHLASEFNKVVEGYDDQPSSPDGAKSA